MVSNYHDNKVLHNCFSVQHRMKKIPSDQYTGNSVFFGGGGGGGWGEGEWGEGEGEQIQTRRE